VNVPLDNLLRGWVAVEGKVQERDAENKGAAMDPAHARKQDGECSLLQHDEVLGGAIMRRDYASVVGKDTFVIEDLCGEKETSDERGVPIKLCVQERLRAQTMGGQLGVGGIQTAWTSRGPAQMT